MADIAFPVQLHPDGLGYTEANGKAHRRAPRLGKLGAPGERWVLDEPWTTGPMQAPDEYDCWQESSPRCPWCGEAMTDEWELDGIYDEGDSTVTDCGSCLRSFKIVTHVRYAFDTEPCCERCEEPPDLCICDEGPKGCGP